ncbi:MAG TPA: electron transport complex subunit RsxC [Gammaproteobacteria bacterium]|nr:electron transport complex subunit RsxC [Gammaproteobacteria bacterium]
MKKPAGKLWHFMGGLHLPDHKDVSTRTPIQQLGIPGRLVIPLQQHIGEPAEVLVRAGDRVSKGQIIARASGYYSASIHASTSGTVVDTIEQPIAHPSGLSAPCIIIKPDGDDRWGKLPPQQDYKKLTPSTLRSLIREAGIVGLGGAGFPTFIKLNPGARHEIDTLILNGAECEPYISCDDMLMRERAEDVIQGLIIMRHALQAKRCLIGIEENKQEAYDAMRLATHALGVADVEVIMIPILYPTGGEKQLIRILTGLEVPHDGLPIDVSVAVHNVATAAAVYDAVEKSQPLISRVVTVTGDGVHGQGNASVLIGTPIQELIEQFGGYTDKAQRLIIGGPMMGFTVSSDQIPVTKTTNCILVASPQETSPPDTHYPCIRCGDCMDVCPVSLLPQQLYWYARARDFDKLQNYHLFDCIECGCCAYVCPSQIPLVQYYRFAKTAIWEQERSRSKSSLARQRFEFREDRLEQEKRERAERMRKKKAALNKPKAGSDANEDPKKAAIKAALERVKKKQATRGVEKTNVDNLTPDQQGKIQQINERRATTQVPAQNGQTDQADKPGT